MFEVILVPRSSHWAENSLQLGHPELARGQRGSEGRWELTGSLKLDNQDEKGAMCIGSITMYVLIKFNETDLLIWVTGDPMSLVNHQATHNKLNIYVHCLLKLISSLLNYHIIIRMSRKPLAEARICNNANNNPINRRPSLTTKSWSFLHSNHGCDSFWDRL